MKLSRLCEARYSSPTTHSVIDKTFSNVIIGPFANKTDAEKWIKYAESTHPDPDYAVFEIVDNMNPSKYIDFVIDEFDE